MQKVINKDFKTLNGEITIPADKSMSHRAIIFSSLAKGKSIIKNFSDGQDPHSTLNIFKHLGVDISQDENKIIINSSGKLSAPIQDLDCGNSGTTMRLLAGLLAGQNFNSTLVGDKSLSKRPMKRIIEPLTLMGANIDSDEYKAPLIINGKPLQPINYVSKIASAQVKSCILLAGLGIENNDITSVTEPYVSRNHTEILLKYMGANIEIKNTTVSISKSELKPIEIDIFGDISSAAYFIVAALIIPNSKIILKNVGLNPTRTGILDVAKSMGGNIKILDKREICGESVGDIQIEYSELNGCNISGEIIPRLIDEIPIIAVLATQAKGITKISDAQDLRNKESDRITAVVTELKKLGANIDETPDGMIINGKTQLTGECEVETYHDHRLAMSLYVAGLITQKPIIINGFEWVDISFPNFEQLFNELKQ
ncbi:MAG: 3-phosphoshikimate 1-carboxyvinyltransferase [Cyanobacteria bacterium SIG26]|nr:3-phosphoshikimate 1-carboxyvinyltransferase [Cyanobacteria bacterium SIG26]